MSLKNLMQRNVITVSPKMSVAEAARIMKDAHVGDVVVVEGMNGSARPVGILTDRDITKYVAAGHLSSRDITVQDIMSRRLITLDENAGLFEAISLMKNNGIRRLPITNGDSRLSGILTSDDITALLASEMKNLSEISQKQIKIESNMSISTLQFQS